MLFLFYSKQEDESGSGEEEGEEWELEKIMTMEELKKPSPQLCSYADDGLCKLVACSKYVRQCGETWYSCLDCQQK